MMNKYTKSTRSRLERAERQNRWLTIIAIATIITLLVAAAGGPTVIRDAAREMFDDHGNEISALPSSRALSRCNWARNAVLK